MIRSLGSLVSIALLFVGVAQANIPEKIFHYGTFDILMKNVQANTVPESDWNQFVMGERSRYGLKWYRRGLYGSSHPAYAAYFADISVGNGKQPWLMEIAITESCRQERPYDVRQFYADSRVVHLIATRANTRFHSAEEFRDRCYTYYPEFKAYIPKFETITNDRPAGECELFLNESLDMLGAKVMIDSDWSESWYLRDRTCIQSIHGTPNRVLEMSLLPGFWSKNTPDGSPRTSNPMENASLLPILAKALAAANSVDETTSSKIGLAVPQSDIRNPMGWQPETTEWVARIGSGLLTDCVNL